VRRGRRRAGLPPMDKEKKKKKEKKEKKNKV